MFKKFFSKLFGFLFRKKQKDDNYLQGGNADALKRSSQNSEAIKRAKFLKQLYQDAQKCNKCSNDYCFCKIVANYMLAVGIEQYVTECEKEALPTEIQNALFSMNDASLKHGKPIDAEYKHFLESFGYDWFNRKR